MGKILNDFLGIFCFPCSWLPTVEKDIRQKALNTQYVSTTGVIHARSNTDPNEYRAAHNNKDARFSITLRLTAFDNSFQDLGWVVNLRIFASAHKTQEISISVSKNTQVKSLCQKKNVAEKQNKNTIQALS